MIRNPESDFKRVRSWHPDTKLAAFWANKLWKTNKKTKGNMRNFQWISLMSVALIIRYRGLYIPNIKLYTNTCTRICWFGFDGIYNIQLITVNFSGLRQRGPKSCTGLLNNQSIGRLKKKITNTRVIDFACHLKP